MPNWCSNTLDVSGTTERLEAFYKANAPQKGKAHLTFEAAVPIGQVENWYDRHIAEWGVKWDASDTSVIRDHANGSLTYRFETPWGAADKWLAAVAKAYPDLRFQLRFGEAGADFVGRIIYAEGECVQEDTWSYVEGMIALDGAYAQVCEDCGCEHEYTTPTLRCPYCEATRCACSPAEGQHALVDAHTKNLRCVHAHGTYTPRMKSTEPCDPVTLDRLIETLKDAMRKGG